MNREEFFEKHLRGELTAAEAMELKRLLASDPEAGRAFVEYTNETALLVRVGTQVQSTRREDNVVPFPSMDKEAAETSDSIGKGDAGTRREGRPFGLLKWAALAACLVALAAVMAALVNRDARTRRIAEIYVAGQGVQVTRAGELLKGDEIGLRPGDEIATATNKMATIVYQHESTRIELQPGTIVVFEDATQGKRFKLRSGTIEARVAPQPAGLPMTVETPQAVATVLGTEFVMRADQHATKLDVLEGKVELACRLTGRKVKVKAGFAATLNPKAPFGLAPLCKTNCILRECRADGTASKSQSRNKKNEN